MKKMARGNSAGTIERLENFIESSETADDAKNKAMGTYADYILAYAYYRGKDYDKSLAALDKVLRNQDLLASYTLPGQPPCRS